MLQPDGRESTDASGFMTRSSPSYQPNLNGNTKERSLLCSHCGRSGHEKDFCWQLIGYPEWWTERNNKTNGRGSFRGGRGSSSSSRGRGRGFATVAHVTSPHASAFPSFSPEEWKAISRMAHEKSNGGTDKLSGKLFSGKITEDVSIDTGASHHMTGDISLLVDVAIIDTCKVGFADGSHTVSTSLGVFPVSDLITLYDVL